MHAEGINGSLKKFVTPLATLTFKTLLPHFILPKMEYIYWSDTFLSVSFVEEARASKSDISPKGIFILLISQGGRVKMSVLCMKDVT